MDARSKRLEKLKNVVIVVLFLSTILLLNLAWRSEGSGRFRLSSVLEFISPDVWVPRAEDFVRPDSAVQGFGDGTFAVDTERADGLYRDLMQIFKRQSEAASFLVNDVTPEQYREMLTGYRSLKIVFPFAIPFGELCDMEGINRTTATDQVNYADALILTAAAPESIFVEGLGRCWRFIADSGEDVASVLLSELDRSGPIYYTAGSILGGSNMALLPLSFPGTLAETSCAGESADDVERAGAEIAESIFGENFDFVRRITDSFGNVTYMYGYGEKTLSCLADGSFEYKTDPVEGPDPGFLPSLQSAISFAAVHGGWGSDRRELNYCLCGASEEGSGRSKMYTFEFAQTADGAKLFSENGPAIIIKVCGGEVSYCRRAVVQAQAAYEDPRDTAEAANVLAGNCHLISSVLGNQLLTASSDEEFSFVAEHFQSVQAGYAVGEQALEPAWMITMDDGTKFFFGLYDAEPLGFTRQ